jgi:hypothetical protein
MMARKWVSWVTGPCGGRRLPPLTRQVRSPASAGPCAGLASDGPSAASPVGGSASSIHAIHETLPVVGQVPRRSGMMWVCD